MVTRYGMSDHFGMVALETVNNAYLGGDYFPGLFGRDGGESMRK